MPLLPIISTLAGLGTIASSVEGLVEAFTSKTNTDALDKNKRRELQNVMAAIDVIPDIIDEMKKSLDDNQNTISGKPQLSDFLTKTFSTQRNNLELIKGRLEAVELSGKTKVQGGDIDDMQKLAQQILDSTDITQGSEKDSADHIQKALDKQNLFSAAIVLDNMQWFASSSKDLNDLLDSLKNGSVPGNGFTQTGSMTIDVRTTGQQLVND
jgi:hypothetical protein